MHTCPIETSSLSSIEVTDSLARGMQMSVHGGDSKETGKEARPSFRRRNHAAGGLAFLR